MINLNGHRGQALMTRIGHKGLTPVSGEAAILYPGEPLLCPYISVWCSRSMILADTDS